MEEPNVRSKRLQLELANGDITMKDFLYKCALWTLEPDSWAHIEIAEFPIPPHEWQEYINMPLIQRAKTTGEFFHQPVIKEYIEGKSRVIAFNKGNLYWLEEIKSYIPDDEEHLAYHLKIDEKLIPLRRWFSSSMNEVMQVFDAKPVNRNEY